MTRTAQKTITATASAKACNTEGMSAEERATAFNNLFGKIPTGRRLLVSFITNIAVSAIGSYYGGIIATILAGTTLLVTGSTFLAYCVLILGFVLTIIGSIILGGKAASYIATGQIDADFKAAKTWVTSKFARKSELEEDYASVKDGVKSKAAAAKSFVAGKFARSAA